MGRDIPFEDDLSPIREYIVVNEGHGGSGVKYDDGKPRYDLLPADALHEVVRVLTFGAQKYVPHNWENGIQYGRVFGAIMRHMWAYWRGEDLDPETNIHHVAHAVTNGLFLLAFVLRGMSDFDDRPLNRY